MQIGDFVRQERLRRKWTQTDLAYRAGVGLNFVYQLEKNKPTVQLDKTNQVLRCLGYELGAKRYFKPWDDQDSSQQVTWAGAQKDDQASREAS